MFTGTKDPNSIEDFEIDWANRAASDPILTSTWTAETGLTVVSSAIDGTKTKTLVRLSGGTVGTILRVTNRVTLTNSAQVLEATVALRIENQ
jgi:hypothetical protein